MVDAPRSIDVIVCTCERPQLLARCVESLDAAAADTSLQVRVLVVDNGRVESAREALAAFAPARIDLVVLREPVSGKSSALNCALRCATGDLIGYIDDDERVHPDWFAIAEREFARADLGFIGGICVLDFEIAPPAWLPSAFPAAIGATDTFARRIRFRADDGPVLLGGNAIVRRALQEKVGYFDVEFGPTANHRQRTGEDHDMFLRYLRAHAEGWYIPDLRIDHWVPAQRLTKRYFRSFVRAHAVARALREYREPQKVAYLLGLPRYEFRVLVQSLVALVLPRVTANPARRFEAELQIRQWCAFAWASYRLRLAGKHHSRAS